MFVCVCVCMCLCICVCRWETGVYSDSKLGQRVSICSQEIFSPYEKYFTWVIPKEGKEGKSQVKWWGIWIGGRVERKHCCNYLKSFV